jgi:hypothetical protein
MLAEEKQVARCVVVHGPSMFFDSSNALNCVGKAKLLVARELRQGNPRQVLSQDRRNISSTTLDSPLLE